MVFFYYQQDYAKTSDWISMKLDGNVGQAKNSFNLVVVLEKGEDPGIIFPGKQAYLGA